MEFFNEAVVSTLKGTLTIPEPIHPTSTHHHKHPHPTALPPPPPGLPGWEQHRPHIDHVGKVGKDALMVFTVIFGIASVITFLMSKRVERKLRLFHNITGVIIITAFLSYLAMSTGMGVAYVPSYKHHDDSDHSRTLRQVFYARYIDWAITTPLLLLDLALLAGLPLVTTITLMLADEAMILTGLIAGLNRSGEKARWVFFAVSCLFYLYVLFQLVFAGRASAKLQSSGVQRVYLVTMAMTVILWTGYPIIFALTEGTGLLNVNTEIITYGILDVLAKVVFGMYLLIAHSHTEGDSIVISEFWTEPRSGRGYGTISQDD